MTSSGTRNPLVNSSMWAAGLPRWCRASGQLAVAHGVVPWARSPRTVAEPVVQRRPTARYCIGERSCASSSTTCPSEAVRWTRSAVSSTRTASACVQRAVFTDRPGLGQSTVRCSSGVRTPSAHAARNSGSESSRSTSLAGSTSGQHSLTSALTAELRATASCTRSSGASPPCSIFSSTACAIRCGRASLAAP